MDEKKVASALAFVIIAAILITFAQAQTALAAANDFSAYASPGIAACGCGTAEGRITVRNTGDFENLFVITAGGEASEFVSIFPSSFVLKPGEQETVHEFVSAPCGAAKEKSYELAVDIGTDTNLHKAISQKVAVSGCSNIGLTLSYQNNTGCRCNKFAYVFMLNNTGSYAETYRFSVDVPAKNAAITPRETTLGQGNYETIRLQLAPECGQKAEYLSFVVSAGKSGFTASMPLRVLMNDSCYGVANYTEAPGKMLILEKYASLLIYLPLAILFIMAVLFAAMTLSKKPKPGHDEKIKAKPRHYLWEQRFRAKTEKLAAERVERAEKKELLTVNAALAVLVIAVAAVIVALISFHMISPEKANMSNLSNVTFDNATNATSAIKAAANATAPANASLKSNFTFPWIKLNITALIPSFLRAEPNSTRRNTSSAPKPLTNMIGNEAQRNATTSLRINFTGIKDTVSSLGSKLKGLTYRNETANAADTSNAGANATQSVNESITSAMAAKAAASKLKSFATAYYGYIIAGFAILAVVITALRMFEARQKKKRVAAKN